MRDPRLSRRTLLQGTALGLGTAALGLRTARAALPSPSSPVTINVVDVAGNLALTQRAIENFRKAKPKLVSNFTSPRRPHPSCPARSRRSRGGPRRHRPRADRHRRARGRHRAGPVGRAAARPRRRAAQARRHLSAARRQDAGAWPRARASSSPTTRRPAARIHARARSSRRRRRAEELLAWAKANPNRFMYARPANSGPGRTFIMGLPYILGDKDPKDPINGWDKTWAYLKELGESIEYYPSGTGAMMKELAEGTRDIIVSTTGWDINPRVLGIVPEEAKVAHAQGLPLGRRRALHGRPEGRVGREARRAARPDELPAAEGAAGLHL